MRLIDADALKKQAVRLRPPEIDFAFDAVTVQMIDNAPTIDAVPVVRCRECKQFNTATAMTYYKDGVHIRLCGCERTCQLRRDDDFCSYGERKDGGG